MRKLLSIVLYLRERNSYPEWVRKTHAQLDKAIDLFFVYGDNKFSEYNKILSSIHSVYVIFLDSNDEITTAFIDNFLRMDYKDDIYLFNYYKKYSDNSYEINKVNVYHANANIISNAIINLSYNEVGLHNKLFNVDLIKRSSVHFNENLGEYIERFFFLSLLKSNPSIKYVDKPIVTRYINKNRIIGYINNPPLSSLSDIKAFNLYIDAISNLFGDNYSEDINNLKIRQKENCIRNNIFKITDYNYYISPNSIVSIWHQDWGLKRRIAVIIICLLNSIGFHTSYF